MSARGAWEKEGKSAYCRRRYAALRRVSGPLWMTRVISQRVNVIRAAASWSACLWGRGHGGMGPGRVE